MPKGVWRGMYLVEVIDPTNLERITFARGFKNWHSTAARVCGALMGGRVAIELLDLDDVPYQGLVLVRPENPHKEPRKYFVIVTAGEAACEKFQALTAKPLAGGRV